MPRSYSRSRSRSRSPERRGRSRSRTPEKFSSKPGSFPKSNDLFSVLVSDLPDDMTKREMEEKFDRYGKIGDIFLPRHRDHGRGRGFGFVRFYERYAQEDCVAEAKKRGIRIDGRDLRIDFAHTRPPVGERRRSRSRSRSPPRRRRSRSRSRSRGRGRY